MIRVLVLLIVISILITTVYFLKKQPEPQPAPKGIVWNLKKDTLPKSEEKAIKAAVLHLESEIDDKEHSYVEIISADVASSSAMISGPLMPRASDYNYTGIFIAIGNKDSSGWHFVTGNDSQFCQFLRNHPLNETDKTYFRGCNFP